VASIKQWLGQFGRPDVAKQGVISSAVQEFDIASMSTDTRGNPLAKIPVRL
jgi:hypothetical protein